MYIYILHQRHYSWGMQHRVWYAEMITHTWHAINQSINEINKINKIPNEGEVIRYSL